MTDGLRKNLRLGPFELSIRKHCSAPSGICKTTIALAIGRAVAEEFAGKAHFVDLESLADSRHVAGGRRDVKSKELQNADLKFGPLSYRLSIE